MIYKTIGYHTVEDRNNPEEILENAPFICLDTDAWLSRGYYFWDNDKKRAHDWGKRYANEDKGYVICEAKLEFTNIFDLVGNRVHQEELSALRKEMKKDKKLSKLPYIGQIISALRKINQKMEGVFSYEGVKAYDIPNLKESSHFDKKEREVTFLNLRIQICVFDKKVLNLHKISIIHPEHYIIHNQS